jgi:hypothetical protein
MKGCQTVVQLAVRRPLTAGVAKATMAATSRHTGSLSYLLSGLTQLLAEWPIGSQTWSMG